MERPNSPRAGSPEAEAGPSSPSLHQDGSLSQETSPKKAEPHVSGADVWIHSTPPPEEAPVQHPLLEHAVLEELMRTQSGLRPTDPEPPPPGTPAAASEALAPQPPPPAAGGTLTFEDFMAAEGTAGDAAPQPEPGAGGEGDDSRDAATSDPSAAPPRGPSQDGSLPIEFEVEPLPTAAIDGIPAEPSTSALPEAVQPGSHAPPPSKHSSQRAAAAQFRPPPGPRPTHGACGFCENAVSGDMICCSICYDFFHPACGGLSAPQVRSMGELERSLWACPDCSYVYELLSEVRKIVVLHQGQPSASLVRLSAADRETLDELMKQVPELGAAQTVPAHLLGGEAASRIGLRSASAFGQGSRPAEDLGRRRLAKLANYKGRVRWGHNEARAMAEALLQEVAGLPEPVEVGGRRLVVEDRAGTLDVLALIEKERRAPMPAGPPPAPTSQAPTKVIAAFPIANAKSQRPLGPSEASFKVDSRHPGARQPGARGPGSKGPSPQRQPSQTNLQGGPAVASARGQRQSAHDPRPAARPLSAEAAQQKPKAVGVKKLGRLGGAAPGAAAAAAPPPQPQAAPSVRRPPPPGGSILADVKYAPHVGLGMRPYVEPEERMAQTVPLLLIDDESAAPPQEAWASPPRGARPPAGPGQPGQPAAGRGAAGASPSRSSMEPLPFVRQPGPKPKASQSFRGAKNESELGNKARRSTQSFRGENNEPGSVRGQASFRGASLGGGAGGSYNGQARGPSNRGAGSYNGQAAAPGPPAAIPGRPSLAQHPEDDYSDETAAAIAVQPAEPTPEMLRAEKQLQLLLQPTGAQPSSMGRSPPSHRGGFAKRGLLGPASFKQAQAQFVALNRGSKAGGLEEDHPQSSGQAPAYSAKTGPGAGRGERRIENISTVLLGTNLKVLDPNSPTRTGSNKMGELLDTSLTRSGAGAAGVDRWPGPSSSPSAHHGQPGHSLGHGGHGQAAGSGSEFSSPIKSHPYESHVMHGQGGRGEVGPRASLRNLLAQTGGTPSMVREQPEGTQGAHAGSPSRFAHEAPPPDSSDLSPEPSSAAVPLALTSIVEDRPIVIDEDELSLEAVRSFLARSRAPGGPGNSPGRASLTGAIPGYPSRASLSGAGGGDGSPGANSRAPIGARSSFRGPLGSGSGAGGVRGSFRDRGGSARGAAGKGVAVMKAEALLAQMRGMGPA